MITLHGESRNSMLFTDGRNAVVIDKLTNMVEETGPLEDLSYIYAWSKTDVAPAEIHLELATGALSDLSITTITAAARLYTIPKGAQEEAKRALEWRKEHKRGGTPVGVNTARILAKGGQIGINKVRHIAKYFPRHEIDKRAEGYKPGEDGFPSRGRIAWGLWGGDTAWRWARQIVERENKALKADASGGEMFEPHYEIYGSNYDSDVSAFHMADAYGDDDDRAPAFAARVRLDGSGIDRLYMIDTFGKVSVWDGEGWDDLGHIDSDIVTYDRSLDDPYDTVEKHHIFIDPQSALILSAHLQESPFSTVSVDDLDEYEATLVAEAADGIDWVMVDAAMVAAGEEPLSGPGGDEEGYTPEERAQNARRQVRDKKGKFSKAGSRVVVGGDTNARGSITRINPESQSVTVKMDDGSTVDVPANQTEAEDTFAPTPIRPQQQSDQQPLDTSGILAQPRAPIDRPNASIPGGLPALGAADLTQIVADFPAWVMSQRGKQQPAATETKWEPKAPGDRAPKYEKSDYLKKLEKDTGTELYTDSAKDHPLLQEFFKKKKNNLYYQPITSAAEANTDEDAPKSEGLGEEITPETSDVQPMYFALVSPDDPRAVMDLVCIVPAASNSTSPMTFKRVDKKWEKDPQILADLTSATPPPVVALTGDVYKDTLAQVDGLVASGLYGFNARVIATLHTAQINPLIAVGEGGLDRNRGKAEKLRRYWLYGKGAAKIRWNTPGDWTRCYRYLSKYMGPRAKGYCALRHKEATGVWTGSKFNVGKRNIRGSAIDGYDVAEHDVIVASLMNRAKIADAKARVTLASASSAPCGSAFSIPLVIPEGVETGDGRTFKRGAITVRELPLPLLWQIKTSDGHDGSVVVGRIDTMERTDDGIGNARGVFDIGPYGREVERMVRNGFIRGVSADLDRFEASEENPNDTADSKSDIEDLKEDLKEEIKKSEKIGGTKIKVDKARVMAVTIVPKPAFEECKIYIEEDTNSSQQQEEDMKPMADGVYVDQVDDLDAAALVACGMVASSIPVVPPATWFADPKLSKPTPLTVDDNGRVYGHIAAWHVDHIGMSYGTKPPRSRSRYAYFHTGVVRADDGSDYPVGQLTLAGGHASLEASAAQAAKHYDDTGSAIADVHAGEDAHGIWVAGALRPSAQPEQIRALRASAPSGDWRPIKGSLELVAVCQVNVPGFPIARARVASGQVYALVAAGAMTLAKLKNDPLNELNNRIAQLEIQTGVRPDPAVLTAKADEARAKIEAVKAERQAALAAKAEELSARFRDGEDYESLGYISMKTRKKLAGEGKALPDGSYPISNESDLRNAIQAYGRSKPSKRASVRRHIMKRARGLGRADLIPDQWKTAGLIDDDVVDDIQARVASIKAAAAEVDNPKALADRVITADAVGGVVVAEEKELAEALVEITQKYGKFNQDDTGVWAGYTPASENDKAEKNISCEYCILYEGGTSCKILAMDVEPMGVCRFALIPDGVVKKNG
jgi:hypothetical protein